MASPDRSFFKASQDDEDSQDDERECDGRNLEVGVQENPHGASPSEEACEDTAPKVDEEIAEEFGEEGDEKADDKVGSGFVLVDFRYDASMRQLDGAAKDLGGREAKDGKAEKTRKRRKMKKKRNHDEERGGVGATENKAIVDEAIVGDEAIVVDAVAHVRAKISETNPDSEREHRTEEETTKAEVEKPAADSKMESTPAAPAARQPTRKTPAKPASGAKKGAASKRSKKEESEEEEEGEAASAEGASTTAVYEDGSAGSIEKKDDKDKVNNDEDTGDVVFDATTIQAALLAIGLAFAVDPLSFFASATLHLAAAAAAPSWPQVFAWLTRSSSVCRVSWS
ncbi:hypothetical protein HPB52_020253 [Rhipicephalus sanguineus]|uniref:Uncharacterized protein n=1 Tax=Rhipicephalus sanguineus TaxID=34632 RepID=A0A9D4PJS8_RHISA|nr:hypothetical protein HPB52_020253 [Rhipicephalus sanguineus]